MMCTVTCPDDALSPPPPPPQPPNSLLQMFPRTWLIVIGVCVAMLILGFLLGFCYRREAPTFDATRNDPPPPPPDQRECMIYCGYPATLPPPSPPTPPPPSPPPPSMAYVALEVFQSLYWLAGHVVGFLSTNQNT